MRQFIILCQKELREAWRSFKFLWMPLLFIFLGISDPLTNYYMEDILGAVGNMPEGFEVLLPELAPADLLLASTGQFQMIGLIVFVATAAGMISKERQNGTATLIYVRPISHVALFLSKLTVISLLGVLSAVAGYGASMYYTAILYGTIDSTAFIQMVATYCVWIVFVGSVSLMLSAACKTAIAMTITMILLPFGIIIDALIGAFWHVTPLKLANYGVTLLTETSPYYSETLWLTIGMAIIFAMIGIWMTKKNIYTANI